MFKKSIAFLLPAILLALVAFKSPKHLDAPPLEDNWYIYNGSGTDPQDQASYYSLEGTTHTPCESETKLCAILIVDDDGTLTNGEVQALIDSENGNTTSSTFPAQSANVDFKE